MAKTLVITQSNYLPWRGYFDLLRSADEVVLLESVQYTRRDWRNRNRIKTASGLQWLTVPVEVKGQFFQAIDETRIADSDWAKQHISAIEVAYARAAHCHSVAPWLFGLIRNVAKEPLLATINECLIKDLCTRLSIPVPIRLCRDVIDRAALRVMKPTERLVAIARELGATRYLSGPAARSYLELELFAAAGIEVIWMNYQGYPDYPQLWGSFEPNVSIIDLLLNTGPDAAAYLQRNAASLA